jgi:hypothetical protein
MRCHAASKRCSTILSANQFNEIGFSAVPLLGPLYAAERGTTITCSIGGYLAVATANHPRRLEPLSAPLRECKVLRFGGKIPSADFSVAACNFSPCKQRITCQKHGAHKLAKFSTVTALLGFRRIIIFLCAHPPRCRKQSKELRARFGSITFLSLHTYIHLSL